MPEERALRIVEAALFSAGKPLAIEDLAATTGLPAQEVRDACEALAREYEVRAGALEVARAGEKWAMQVRAEWAPAAAKLAPMEVPLRTLKTLALIAFHQPILQSELKRMVGERVYEHVHELHERGLIVAREQPPSKLLTTSERFPEYFGIPETEPERIRTFLAEKLGIKVEPRQEAAAAGAAPGDQEPPRQEDARPAEPDAGEQRATPTMGAAPTETAP